MVHRRLKGFRACLALFVFAVTVVCVLFYTGHPVLTFVTHKGKTTSLSQVIILAYMRGGSSFAGKIFDSNNDAFYVFEPLWHIYDRALMHPDFMLHVDGPAPVQENATLFAQSLLKSYLTCDIKNIPVINYYDPFLREGRKTAEFYRCGKDKQKCVQNLTSQCQSSAIRVIKTIRIRMADIMYLLDHLPALKIVHLVRDPRGIISSRSRGGGNYNKLPDIMDDGQSLCKDMLENLKTEEMYDQKHPGRIIRLRYEDLADEPDKVSELLYSYLDATMAEGVREWIQNNTRAASESRDFMGTRRMNSSLTASNWRHSFRYSLVRFMDEKCPEVYKKVGYLALANYTMLKDYRYPVKLKTGSTLWMLQKNRTIGKSTL